MTERHLPERAHALFEKKGPENAARVRRVVQLVSTLLDRADDWSGLRVLDLGCGEGLFALEAACHGADVLAVEGRAQRLDEGRALKDEAGLDNLRFEQADVRAFPFEDHGPFDVVLSLGVLYHLDAPDLFEVVHRIGAVTRRALVVETHVARRADETVEHGGHVYRGWRYREHDAGDDEATRAGRLLASLDNATSFWPDAASLDALLEHAGFPTVLECRAPAQPTAPDRMTLVALKGGRPPLAAFPWVDGIDEDEMAKRARSPARTAPMPPLTDDAARARTDVMVTLGTWTRTRPAYVFGFDDAGAGLWSRAALEAYTGGLRRVPPLLAVVVAGPVEPRHELAQRAADLLAAGAGAVWLVRPGAACVVVVTQAGTRTVQADETLPAPPGVAGLAPLAADLLGRRS